MLLAKYSLADYRSRCGGLDGIEEEIANSALKRSWFGNT
jgi:hypothetical protein